MARDAANAIMDAAERLFGMQGFAATSLRSICLAAGQGNNFAVQHHFVSKERLAIAVFRRRMSEYEQTRAGMLAEIKRNCRANDPLALMEILFLPLVAKFPDEGAVNYARFVMATLYSNEFRSLREDSIDAAPITVLVLDLLGQSLANVPAQIFRLRMRPCALLFLNLVLDEPFGVGAGPFLFQNDRHRAALGAALAALSSPMPAEVSVRPGDFYGKWPH
jgi:AcrR family transcriptional regulator